MAKNDSDILAVLPTARSLQKWATTPDIATRLRSRGITVNHVKTVQRRLELMLDQGLVTKRRLSTAIEWQRNEGVSGIAASSGSLMTFDEALALQVLRRFASRQIPTLVSTALDGLFTVSKERLTKGERNEGRRHARWDRKIAVVDGAFERIRQPVKESIFQQVSQALFAEQLLEMDYRASAQTVMPLGLVEAGDLIYLVAQVPGKPAAVMYRLDRMERAQATDRPFTYPRDFALSSYVNKERKFDFFPRGNAQVVLRFAPNAAHGVLEAPLSRDQTFETDDAGFVTISATVMLSERLRWWIRSYGPYVEVLEPQDLRQDFIAEAKEAFNLYSDAGRVKPSTT
ncbi:helix-turn-helix transcriptional regulator [Paraburkholderia lycopersici]|uniref:Predicted DNA-binding transcriptional regulator YafY, contains an HTH and WYL domains n=1 Tax=Paraburkholderia lycopersici TaxID=416944 RepID=A0A1G6Q4A5_9BURK|nr:WYL domain-containing protein [Paraburkholderia lycopersici]SDC86467.1 Predicted DNA-binding transcriptional regulator YafY, contains an HTH and WYL domains [Paraburkholderia lycopersici]